MDRHAAIEVINIDPSEFCLLFGDEGTIATLDGCEETKLILYGNPVTLPPVKLLRKEKQHDKGWLAVFTCLSAEDNKKCFWILRLCQPQYSCSPIREITLPKRHLYAWGEKDRQKRLEFLRQHTGHPLTHIANTSTLKAESLKKNIEGFIGSVEIPVGIAGPLRLRGRYANDVFYAPVATTEGALIASISRGANAITQSSGATAHVLERSMMRVPRFEFDSLSQCLSFTEWVADHDTELHQIPPEHSRFALLKEIKPKIIGNAVHLTFCYQTANAAGQNMTTVCTWHICQWIQQHLPAQLQPRHFILESNLSSDKKSSWGSFNQGRGTKVVAEAKLTQHVCRSLLRLEPAMLVKAFHTLSEGAIAAGITGMNINTANVIAGMFTALGQDIACSHESSLSQLQMQLTEDNGVYCSITLPALIIGTVGGGTALPCQAEYLQMLGCQGEHGVERLAEIIAGFCLALDISTLAALANDEFARSHQILGRGKKTGSPRHSISDPLISCFNNATYFGTRRGQHPVTIDKSQWQGNKNSILTTNCGTDDGLPVGIFAYKLRWQDNSELEVVLKNKPQAQTIIEMLSATAEQCSTVIVHKLKQILPALEFNHARKREIMLIQQASPQFTRYIPTVYGVYQHHEGEYDIVIEERLSDELMLNSFSASIRWQSQHLSSAISGIADIHALWYQKEEKLKQQYPLVSAPDIATIINMVPLWLEIASLIQRKQPELFPASLLAFWFEQAGCYAENWREIESMPRTMVHNDFNPRNIAFRKEQLRLCCWDWELATLHIPQRDLAELLTYVLDENACQQDVLFWVDFHRQALERSLNIIIDAQRWYQGYRLALFDFGLRRISLYLMFNYVNALDWFPRVMKTFTQLISLARQNP